FTSQNAVFILNFLPSSLRALFSDSLLVLCTGSAVLQIDVRTAQVMFSYEQRDRFPGGKR
ncbi:MAG: hypothetical protein ACPG5T_04300, partial [Endozoicomonas sp.]